MYDKSVHPAIQDLLQDWGQEFKVSAPDPYTVVINTLKALRRVCSMRCARAACRLFRSTFSKSRIKNGTFAAAYNVATPPDRLVTGGAWRVVQYVRARKRSSAAIRIISGSISRTAAAVSGRAGRFSSCPTRMPPI